MLSELISGPLAQCLAHRRHNMHIYWKEGKGEREGLREGERGEEGSEGKMEGRPEKGR